MRPIDNWRQAHKFYSEWAVAALVVLSLVQTDVLPYIQPLVSPRAWAWIVLIFAVVIGAVRLIAQNLPTSQPPEGKP